MTAPAEIELDGGLGGPGPRYEELAREHELLADSVAEARSVLARHAAIESELERLCPVIDQQTGARPARATPAAKPGLRISLLQMAVIATVIAVFIGLALDRWLLPARVRIDCDSPKVCCLGARL
jgi:hypothetical protein